MEQKTFSNNGERFETEKLQQSEFDSLFEDSNIVNKRRLEQQESRFWSSV